MKEERREKRKQKEAQMRRVAYLEALMEENYRNVKHETNIFACTL